jgi:O-antigen/teichoic acid export membrane protein
LSTSSLKQRFVRGFSWTLAGYALSQILRLGSSLILTRLLAPDIYGVMAIGYMVVTALVMFSDIGLAAGAIQSRRGEDPTYLNVAWIVQIARGMVIMLVALGLSGAMALGWLAGLLPPDSVYADPRIPGLLAVVSLYGLVSGFESTKVFFARRTLALAQLTRIDLASQVVATVFMIAWAFYWPSVWALASGWVFGALLKTVLTHLALPGPTNRLQWDRAAFLDVFHFGKWALLSSTFTFFLGSGDRLLLGAMLSATTMGFYSVALILVGALQAAVGKIVGYVVLPALSEVARERPAELKDTIYRIRRPLDLVCLLLSGALFFLGEPLIGLLYDSRYSPAGWMLGVLAVTLTATRLDIFDQCLVAMSRVRLLSGLNAARLIALYSLVPLGFFLYGVEGAVGAVAVSALVNSIVVLTLQAWLKLIDVRHELLAIPVFGTGLLVGWLVRTALH